MPNYTVTTVQKQEREPEIQGKVFHSYLLGILDHAGKVELLQNPSSPPPAEGEVIEGAIVTGKEKDDGTRWPDKLKKVNKQQGFRPRDPKESASIVRQHSQEMAIRWLTFTHEDNGKSLSLADLTRWIDWFQADANGSSEAPTEPSKPVREAIPRIPRDRAHSILRRAREVGRVEDGKPDHVLRAKLADVGVGSGLITDLTVDQAEAFEAWLANE